jgi:photosynthetic reaction center H subunit
MRIDITQIVLYAFWGFFAALVYYLRREDKREGYPMVNPDSKKTYVGWPSPPPKKQRTLPTGEEIEL